MKERLLKTILVVNILSIICLIFSILAPFINPNTFWPISFLGLFFPIILISIIIFILYHYMYNKKWMWINISILVLSIPTLTRYISINRTNTSDEKNIKIMSYNIRLFNKNHDITKKDIQEKILDIFNDKEIDILCIQEYYDPDNNIDIHFKYSHIGKQKMKNNAHMAIYSNYPQIRKRTVVINGKVMNNTCIYSDIKIDKDTIRVYNIHLASNYFSKEDIQLINSPYQEKEHIQKGVIGILKRLKKSFTIRSKEVEEISKHIQKSPYPSIICGDFNDTPNSYAYQRLMKNKNDAFLKSGNGFGATYFKIPMLRIDYILYDNKLESRNFTTHQKEYSDHKAISADIILNKKDN